VPVYIFTVEKISHSYIPVFEKIKDKVRKKFIFEKAKLLALQQADKIIKTSKTIEDILKLNFKHDTTDFIPLFRPFSQKLASLDLKPVANLNKKGDILKSPLKDSEAAYIVWIDDVAKFNEEQFEKNKDKIKNAILKEKLNFRINKLLTELRKKSKIQINEKILR
jgi:peptidyl-prolyl cis-trans isomerase D